MEAALERRYLFSRRWQIPATSFSSRTKTMPVPGFSRFPASMMAASTFLVFVLGTAVRTISFSGSIGIPSRAFLPPWPGP